MNKEKALERLDAIESEAKELREIIKAPEQRTPEQGDVWQDKFDSYLVGENESISLGVGDYPGGCSIDPSDFIGDACLGKFNGVYVKISDVREALGYTDNWGDSVLSTVSGGKGISLGGITTQKTREALRKLDIITD